MISRHLLCLAVVALAACSSGSGGGSGGGSGTGGFDRDDIGTPVVTPTGGSLSIATGGGIAFSNRIVTANGNASNVFDADILPGTAITPTPASGSARMTGPFALRHATGLRKTGTTLEGQFEDRTGTITLDADFAAGTLRGQGGGLSVNGRFGADDTLTGTASYRGTSGPLAGFVGGSNAIGIFKGNTAQSSLAGGFVVAK